jgi:hypothetical protein
VKRRKGRGEQTIDIVFQTEQGNGSLDRRGHPARLRAERRTNALLQYHRQSKGRDDRERGGADGRPNDQPLDHQAHGEAKQRHQDERDPETGRSGDDECEHGADHKEVAMGDIDDVEQAEDDGKAKSDQSDDQPPNQPINCQRDDQVHFSFVRPLISKVRNTKARNTFARAPPRKPASAFAENMCLNGWQLPIWKSPRQ